MWNRGLIDRFCAIGSARAPAPGTIFFSPDEIVRYEMMEFLAGLETERLMNDRYSRVCSHRAGLIRKYGVWKILHL